MTKLPLLDRIEDSRKNLNLDNGTSLEVCRLIAYVALRTLDPCYRSVGYLLIVNTPMRILCYVILAEQQVRALQNSSAYVNNDEKRLMVVRTGVLVFQVWLLKCYGLLKP